MEPEVLLPATAPSGIFTGLGNKTREENARWWNTRAWLIQAMLWLALIDGIATIALIQTRHTEPGFTLNGFMSVYMGLMGWFVAFGVIILTQSDVIGEKQSGTAEWVLSSPLSRESFILSKLIVNLVWLVAILVVLQGVVFNLVLGALGTGTIAWSSLLAGLGLQALYLAFWLTLVLMLGTFFRNRNAVIGVPLILVFLQTLIPSIVGGAGSWVSLLLPQRIPDYAIDLVLGKPLPSLAPILIVTGAILAFVLLAILRFNREEFTGT
ncbi:MAG: ABC transporter permease [Candidatus Lutacidiplasmatales archaeon]